MSKPSINYYDELGVSSKASQETIKKAYQQLVLKVHPDKLHAGLSESEHEDKLSRYHKINQAWRILGDEEKRQQYDKGLREQNLLQEWPVNAEVDLDDMEYTEETSHYSWRCRCSGDYIITEQDLEQGQSVVCCSMCTLCIRVLYEAASDHEDNEHS